jgi:hypothetical protein
MKFNLSCKDATRLVLEGEERPLGVAERLGLRLHMAICAACPKFLHQVRFMRSAMGRWKRYAADDEGTPPAA